MAAAFGTTDNRKLDNTSPSIVKNPGPGTYVHKDKPDKLETSVDRAPSSVFKSLSTRADAPSQVASSLNVSPASYNIEDHKSISRKPLQGGAPNNVLSLHKAENKKMIDNMFPFLVKGRMEDNSKINQSAHLGPGSYSPSNVNYNA